MRSSWGPVFDRTIHVDHDAVVGTAFLAFAHREQKHWHIGTLYTSNNSRAAKTLGGGVTYWQAVSALQHFVQYTDIPSKSRWHSVMTLSCF